MRSERWVRLVLLAAVPAALMLFAACGDDDEEEVTGIPELADGVLQVGADIAYAPIEFFEEGATTPQDLDTDLANAPFPGRPPRAPTVLDNASRGQPKAPL